MLSYLLNLFVIHFVQNSYAESIHSDFTLQNNGINQQVSSVSKKPPLSEKNAGKKKNGGKKKKHINIPCPRILV